ncbi:Trans-resveratrol di-O-methyltransferase [Capsicum annuum]|nr:Trans-resveratrol di-O-methyltransferase [Capsicum annuum]
MSKDEPLSLAPFVQIALDPSSVDQFHYLSQWFHNGDSSTPFETAYGKPLFENAENEPKISHLFNEAMASDALLVISVVTESCKGVFEGMKSMVDVGGGTETVAKVIANVLPEINCIVFNLPHVIEGCEGSKNLSYVGGDMFKSIPSADAILLKWILHDWHDENCIKILKKCKEAIPNKKNGGKAVIIDIVILNNQKGDDKSYETQLFYDMTMMTLTSGKERSEQEWAKLFLDADFSDYSIVQNLGLRFVIVVYP